MLTSYYYIYIRYIFPIFPEDWTLPLYITNDNLIPVVTLFIHTFRLANVRLMLGHPRNINTTLVCLNSTVYKKCWANMCRNNAHYTLKWCWFWVEIDDSLKHVKGGFMIS